MSLTLVFVRPFLSNFSKQALVRGDAFPPGSHYWSRSPSLCANRRRSPTSTRPPSSQHQFHFDATQGASRKRSFSTLAAQLSDSQSIPAEIMHRTSPLIVEVRKSWALTTSVPRVVGVLGQEEWSAAEGRCSGWVGGDIGRRGACGGERRWAAIGVRQRHSVAGAYRFDGEEPLTLRCGGPQEASES